MSDENGGRAGEGEERTNGQRDGATATRDTAARDTAARDSAARDSAARDTAARDTVRVRYSKLGKIRFTSHRDVARMWERALRRSGLRVAYSQGFSPRPLLSFGLALPTGSESLADYLDIRLEPGAGPELEGLVALFSSLLPEGLDATQVGRVPPGAGSLQQEVTSCSWELEVLGSADEALAGRVEQLLGAPSVPIRRERKGRQVEDDLRPSVLALVAVPGQNGLAPDATPRARLRAELATRPRGVRPQELLQGLGEGLTLARARRTHQWIESGGIRTEPLYGGCRATGATDARAEERVR
jgi:radical SAM-linked protein